MNRALRALAFSGALVGSAFYMHKRTKLQQMGIQGFPTPLPEFEGGTNDDHLTDTVNRYSRMAPIYDQALDTVEQKYNGFGLRKELVSQAHGHVLEIGVGTARNLPYYDNTQVKSITFVDSTYPMLNAALVKMHDLYKIHEKDTALVTVDHKFQFEVKKAKSFTQLNEESIQFFKKQFDSIASGGDGSLDDILNNIQNHADNDHHEADDDDGCTTCQNTPNHLNRSNPSSSSSEEIIHSTYRPQILYPIDQNTDPDQLLINFNHILKTFPISIQKMFTENEKILKLGNLSSTINIEDEQVIGSKLLRAPEKPLSVEEQQAKLRAQQQEQQQQQHHQNTSSTITTTTPLFTPTDGVTAAKRSEIESYDRGQREVAKKISQGQSWKQVTQDKNVIPAAFVHLDCHDLSFFPSNSYDTIVDTFGLCSFHHPVDVLNEIRRICKPGGQILLLEHGLGTNPMINQVIRSTNDSHKKQWGCDRSKDIVQLLSEAGYDVKKIKRYHGGTTVVWDGAPAKSTLEVQEILKNQTPSQPSLPPQQITH